jgi:hypothetical protein
MGWPSVSPFSGGMPQLHAATAQMRAGMVELENADGLEFGLAKIAGRNGQQLLQENHREDL